MIALANGVGIGSRVLLQVCVRVSGADLFVVTGQASSNKGLIPMDRYETLSVRRHATAGSIRGSLRTDPSGAGEHSIRKACST